MSWWDPQNTTGGDRLDNSPRPWVDLAVTAALIAITVATLLVALT